MMTRTSDTIKSAELIELAPSFNLFLKPVARVSITVQIPTLHDASGQLKSLTTWEVIEKLRQLSPGVLSPPTPIKVVRTTLEFVRFIAEVECKADVKRVVTSLDSQNLRVRASEAPSECPRRHDWEAFFRDAKDMDETKPGERPDTVLISGLPVRWFSQTAKLNAHQHDTKDSCRPKEKPIPEIVKVVFEAFGAVRLVDIPMLDPVQTPTCLDDYVDQVDAKAVNTFKTPDVNTKKHNISDRHYQSIVNQLQRSSWESEPEYNETESRGFGKIGPDTIAIVSKDILGDVIRKSHLTEPTDKASADSYRSPSSMSNIIPLTFTAYIQYANYVGFSKAMEALRSQKLVFAPNQPSIDDSSDRLYYTAEIKVDFDRCKHLSRANIDGREFERRQLVAATLRRRAEAKTAAEAEEKQLRLAENAKRKLEERRQAEALAKAAEKEIKRAAKLEQRKQMSIERCRRDREALLEQKVHLDERRRLVATRKVEAIRLMTFLLARIQQRHNLMVASRCATRLQKTEPLATLNGTSYSSQKTTAPLFNGSKSPNSPEAVVLPQALAVDNQLPESGVVTGSPLPPRVDAEEKEAEKNELSLQTKLLQRRELLLRSKLLKRHLQAKQTVQSKPTRPSVSSNHKSCKSSQKTIKHKITR